MPLLIAAELVAQRRIPGIVRQFFDRRIIASTERARFEKVVTSIMRFGTRRSLRSCWHSLRSGFWMWQEYPTLGGSTWYVAVTNGKMLFTPAGYWYVLISLPILRFLLFRWYFRLALWYLFLWRIRRFPLHLNFLHPDLAGGLGFLSGSTTTLAPVLVAQTMIAAGVIADEIRYAGIALPSFKMEIAAIVIFLVLLLFAPLCFFMVQLIQAGRKAKRKYGMLASRYVDDFWNKWFAKHGTGSKNRVSHGPALCPHVVLWSRVSVRLAVADESNHLRSSAPTADGKAGGAIRKPK